MQTSHTVQRTETRLERHRQVFVESKFVGQLLRIDDLDPVEIELLNAEFFDRCRRRGVTDLSEIYQAYIETLHSWGVMCPHPQHLRTYEGLYRSMAPPSFSDSAWFNCDLCGAGVINR